MIKTITRTIGHETDSHQRIWVRALLDLLDTCNPDILTRTADTGQVIPENGVVRSVNNTTDYAVYKLSDGLGPDLYIKVLMGCAHNVVIPAIRLWIGLGTNGAGQITNSLILTPMMPSTAATLHPGAANRDSTAVVIPGQVALVIGADQERRPAIGGFILSRPTDLDGNWINTPGVCVLLVPHAANSTSIVHATVLNGWASPVNNLYTSVGPLPMVMGSWAVNGEVQPAPLYHCMPHFRPHSGGGLVSLDDIALNSQFDAVFAGSSPKSYRNIGLNTSYTYVSGSALMYNRYFTICPRVS